jgi:hypothetical protein
MITFFISIFLYAQANDLTAQIPKYEVWSLFNNYFPIEQDQQSHHLISIKCKSNKCDAYKALNDVHKKNLNKKDLQGGKNPGAVICNKYFKATVIILKDKDMNENAFCQFTDGSLISASALH